MPLQHAHSVPRVNMSVQINTCCTADLYKCRTTVGTTSLTAEAWHHFLKINHDIIAELTQPLSLGCVGTVQAPAAAVMWHLCSGILLICIQSEGRLTSSSSSFHSHLPEDPASLPSPLFLRCAHADADGSTNNPPSLPPFSLTSLPPSPPHSPETVHSI